MVDHARTVTLALLGSLTLLIVGYVRGVFAAPGKLEKLTVIVDTVAVRQERQGVELRAVGEATWTFVALQCMTMDDSSFVSSRLPCGKAFQISGVTRRLTR